MQHRILLLSADRSAVRATADGEAPSIDADWPSSVELRDAVGAPRARAIRSAAREADGVVTHVLWDADGDGERDGAGPWVPVARLAPPALRARVAEAVAAYDADLDDDRQPWYRRGWFEAAEVWTDAALAGTGRARTGAPDVVKLWGLSALLRMPVRAVDGAEGAVWFKAACEVFRAEPALTAVVADLAPDLVPRLIRTDTARAWMLMEEFPAASERADVELAAAAARSLAELQLRSAAHIAELLAAGAPERGTTATLHGLEAVLEASAETDQVAPEKLAAARAAAPALADVCRRLEACGLPTTVVHGDLHSGNIAGTAERPVIFDWTDACVGHPYLDGALLVRGIARETDAPGAAVVREAFLAPWRAAHPDVDHDEAWALADVFERVFTTVTYERIMRVEPLPSRWELGGTLARLIGELGELIPPAPTPVPVAETPAERSDGGPV